MYKSLLLSNSSMPGTPYLEWCRDILNDFLKSKKNIIFIPYAAVRFSFDEYENMVLKGLSIDKKRFRSIHALKEKIKEIKNCDAVVTGGGNTFVLKKRLEDENLFNEIKAKIKDPDFLYSGWSAGANLGGLSIKTTNDMPIVQPLDFNGLGSAHFQINPHYTDKALENHGGESRDDRLTEFSIVNPNVFCAAIPEGSGLFVETNGKKARYFSIEKPGKIFHQGQIQRSLKNGEIFEIP
ncbi:MAG: dipeptidase PepE [Desulfobacteraceae bacterium]|nr:dipeptidase PepE [Desulfobacteraceae bacterium]MCB9494247.1 dipeptidase PepE [Desulfobacteraceae bacterium]